MTFIKLVTRNDWGVEYFARPGEGLSAHGTSDVRKYGLKFRDGDALHVRWPDGSTTVEEIRHEVQRTTVSDHGHSYPVEYKLAGFINRTRRIAQWVRLDAVEIAEEDLPTGSADK